MYNALGYGDGTRVCLLLSPRYLIMGPPPLLFCLAFRPSATENVQGFLELSESDDVWYLVWTRPR